ncbi:uncharacterized protein TNCV_2284001 [Trichonephila clavipes]|nr:uncharacterized protein TNCV_2284001 [Trichonephila clavipes]
MALGDSLPQINLGAPGVVEDKATDYAHLKQALTEQFPVVRNRSELETRFFASSQNHNQKPSDFVYNLLKIHKILKLEMTEEKLTFPERYRFLLVITGHFTKWSELIPLRKASAQAIANALFENISRYEAPIYLISDIGP